MMDGIPLDKARIDLVLEIRRRVREEFGELLRLGGDGLEGRLESYAERTRDQRTARLIRHWLGTQATPEKEAPKVRYYRGQPILEEASSPRLTSSPEGAPRAQRIYRGRPVSS